MPPECVRQLCDNDAVALCAIDPPATTVLLVALDAAVVGSPLCRRHADGLRAPAGWQLRDERDTGEPAQDGSTVPEAVAPQAREFEHLLDASSPLLSRAFRTAGSER